MTVPPEAQALVSVLAPHFTSPTYQRFLALLVGTRVATGRRTVATVLRTLRHLAPGHPTDYQRVLFRAPWSGLALGCALMRFVLDHLVPDGPVLRVGDDTGGGHKGACVYGQARHRDPVRSRHSYTAFRYGHTWVVLAVLVTFPFATRPWARLVLIDPYRSADDDRKRNRAHRTPARIMCVLLGLLLIRFPGRTFLFAGDSGYGTHALTLVSTWHPDANLFDPPPLYPGRGRPRVKGAARPKPREAVAAVTTFTRLEVGWYGGGTGCR
ncbi:MAG TPA: transposase [Gemmata sp.]